MEQPERDTKNRKVIIWEVSKLGMSIDEYWYGLALTKLDGRYIPADWLAL